MITVGVREAREKLAEFLDEVEKGEDVVITRRDRPVAKISSLKKVVRRRLASRKSLRSSIEARGEPVSKVVVTDRREGDR